jgi:oxygen-independent coproporphyrinogen-3 oxidase
MAGIYLHIPFCKQACSYCDFHFSTQLKNKEKLVHALAKEIELRHHELPSKKLSSIYFGGGTPSLLSPSELDLIFEKISRYFQWDKQTEITLEANPDDLKPDYLRSLRQSPINRLSIGLQSFKDEQLRFMNRAHTAAESQESVLEAKAAGFEKFTVDLIYGLPQQSLADWTRELEQLATIDPPHFSAYALTVEEKTSLHHQVKKGLIKTASDRVTAAHFEALQDFAKALDYQHYELSNFAKAEAQAIHNSNYWRGVPYLGIGPGGHSFSGEERSWNIRNNPLYIKSIEAGQLPLERESLSEADQYNEKIMTALRLEEGLDLNCLSPKWRNYALQEATGLLNEAKLQQEGHKLRINTSWRFHSDGIAAQLFWVD